MNKQFKWGLTSKTGITFPDYNIPKTLELKPPIAPKQSKMRFLSKADLGLPFLI